MNFVESEVARKTKNEQSRPVWGREVRRCFGIVIGSVIYAYGFNLFLSPLNLCAGGFMGVSQMFDIFLRKCLKLECGSLELPGLIYYVLNIPWLFVAYKTMRPRFVFKTIFAVTCFSFLLTIVPTAKNLILEEKIANTLVAGLMCGVGIGLVLRMGASDGGMDLLGMIIIQKQGHSSVGRINLICNVILYLVCLIVYDFSSVIYSLVFVAVLSFTIDKVHVQNINSRVHIVTQKEDSSELELEIMGQLGRGITKWKASGSYSGKDETILMVVVSKYEIRKLRSIIHEIDPNAFVLIDEGVDVVGNFLKKLT